LKCQALVIVAGPGYKLLWNIFPISLAAIKESAETEAKLLLVLLPPLVTVAEENGEDVDDELAALGRGSIPNN
jgi:hypothetical protein